MYINDLREQGKRLAVYLDKAELRNVVAYDIERRTVTKQVLDGAGKVFVVAGRVATETLSGEVTVEIVDV